MKLGIKHGGTRVREVSHGLLNKYSVRNGLFFNSVIKSGVKRNRFKLFHPNDGGVESYSLKKCSSQGFENTKFAHRPAP